MCDKPADAFLPGLKLVPDWFITPSMLEDLDNDVIFNNEINLDNDDPDRVKFFNDSPNNVTSSYCVIGLVNINFKNINLDGETNDDDLDTITFVKLIA